MWQYIFNQAMFVFAQAATGNPEALQQIPNAVGSYQHTVWHTILLIVYFVICLGLVLAVLLQTTKQEGLSGVIGGSAQAVFKGKKGMEEHLQQITNYLAVSFIVMSLLVTFLAFRVH